MTAPRPTVLLVDDSATNLAVLNRALKDHYRVRAVKRGADALRLAAAEPPDLILLDQHMPQLDGLAVCRRLKADPVTAAVPVVFISAEESPAGRQAALAAGALDLLVKPVEPAMLLARVAWWLGDATPGIPG